jgi:RNA polymerase sigma-70 factor (ECF subfamily)
MAIEVTEIWEQVHNGLRAFIAKRIADEAEVDDILQEVFLRMHRGIDALKDPQRVVSWIYQITRHAIIDHYRAPERRREMPAGLAADMEAAGTAPATSDVGDSKDSGEHRAELAGCLRPMIDRLDKGYREALILVELEGLTQEAAAKRIGLSLSGMKSRVQRGRRQLKRKLSDCCLIELDQRNGVADYTLRDPKQSSC